jgi:cell division protein FtsQ
MTNSRGNIFFTKNILWLALFVVISIILVSAIDFKLKSLVKSINIEVVPLKASKDLITKKDIKTLLRNWQGYDPEMANIEELNLLEMEAMLNKVKFVKNAEVYLSSKNKLNVIVSQREPIVRITSAKGDYYLDVDGYYVPFSENNTARVPIATGNIGKYKEDFQTKGKNTLKDVFEISQSINADPFLNALVEQIHVESNGELVLIPKVGREKIFFGYTDRIDEKFENLKIFYKNALPREGWNKYKYLNLKWENQVVGGM